MSKTYVLLPDQHADPGHNNDRADWMGRLIADVKPDVLVNIGDAADMASLSTHNLVSVGSYEEDINAHLSFQERLFAPMKVAKKRQPRKVFLVGNHEYRITRTIENNPQFAGEKFGLSMKDLDLDRHYHNVVQYESDTPGVINLDGIDFAHFFISGVMGRPIGGVNHARAMVLKNMCSSIQGHSHLLDYAEVTNSSGKTFQGMVVGVGSDQAPGWAGLRAKLWRPGVAILRGVKGGNFSFQWVNMKDLKKEYG